MFVLTNEANGSVAKGEGLQGARVGGQGFDPCLLHDIFMNICLQIQWFHHMCIQHMPPYHHHWIIHYPDPTPQACRRMVDSLGKLLTESNAGDGPT